MNGIRTLAVLALLGSMLATGVTAPAGEPASLHFAPRPDVPLISTHYVFPLCVAAVGQVQAYYRTGEDTPMSAQYLLDRVGRSDGIGGDITARHGFTNPYVAQDQLERDGCAPLAIGPDPNSLLLKYVVTQPMIDAAAAYRSGGFVKPLDYADAIGYIAGHPGACLLVSTYGYAGYVVVQADDAGNAMWLDYNQHTGPPDVLVLDRIAGDSLFRSMTEGQPLGPENYSLIVEMR